MALAYALVLVEAGLYDHDRRTALQYAQKEADIKFHALATEHRRTLVTRNPEPRVMTVPEMEQQFPTVDPKAFVGLYFEADIS
jgi:hypothetical protein